MLMILHVLSEAYISGSFIRHTMPHLCVCEMLRIRSYYSACDNGLHFMFCTWSFIVRCYGQGMFDSDHLCILKLYVVYRQNLNNFSSVGHHPGSHGEGIFISYAR